MELVRSVSCSKMGTAMLTYEDLVELAKLCARNSAITEPITAVFCSVPSCVVNQALFITTALTTLVLTRHF